MLLTGIPANSICSLRELSHAYYAFQWWWISFCLEMEPPDTERVAVGTRDHSLVSSLKECMSRRNLILQSVHPGVDILNRFLNVQHHKVEHATQTFFSSDAQLCSCQKCFSHYHQPPSLHQSGSSLSSLQYQMQKHLYFSIASVRCMVHPKTQEYLQFICYSTPVYIVGRTKCRIINTHKV